MGTVGTRPQVLVDPWGDDYRSGFANLDETGGKSAGPWKLQQTTAVGLYPHGVLAFGVEDLYGMIWEWCRNGADDPGDTAAGGEPGTPTLRGGSWDNPLELARADDPRRYLPHGRNDCRGFRLLWSGPVGTAQ